MRENLAERLAALDAEARGRVRVAPPSLIRAHGDRRRTRFVAASVAAATAAVAVTSGVAAMAIGPDGSEPAAPVSVRLPHEGETGWHAKDDRNAPALFAGCGTADPTRPGRVAARTASGPAPLPHLRPVPRMTEQLFLYENEPAATTAMANLVEAVRACGWLDSDVRSQPRGAQQIAALRAGNAVFLLGVTTGTDLVAMFGADELYEIARRLCTELGLCDPTPAMFPLPEVSPLPPR